MQLQQLLRRAQRTANSLRKARPLPAPTVNTSSHGAFSEMEVSSAAMASEVGKAAR